MTKLDLNASPAKSFFLGNILENNIFPFPQINESEKETLQMVIDSVNKFMHGREAEFAKFDREGYQSEEFINSLKELGLFGLIIPEEYGGIGLSNASYARVIQQTTRHDGSTSLTIGAHSSIGMKGLLLFGTDAQKRKYLPKLASGETIAAFCLTEPGAGSDAASIKTKAVKNPDGTWTLNGSKLWITNGSLAGFFTVFARTDSAEGKMSAFIVERNWEGVQVGPKEDKMGIRASATNPVDFINVKIPAENLLGAEGKGFKVAMAILNNGRTGLGGGAIGGMKACIEMAVKQSAERKQFGKSINQFGLVQEKIAQMTVDCFATESVVAQVAHYIDSGVEDYSIEAAISKIFASEALWRVANDALQIAGGNGFMKHYPYERIVRDSRINMIFEGTNQILRLFIALAGMKVAGEYLKGVSKNLAKIFNDPIKGFGVLSDYATKKIQQLTPLGHDQLESVDPSLKDEAQIFAEYTLALAKSTEEILKKYGKDVIEEQFHMQRLGDIAIDLFVGLSVLSRVTNMIKEKGLANCTQEISIAKIFSQAAKRRMNQNLRRLEKNEDQLVGSLAKHIADQGYKWDLI